MANDLAVIQHLRKEYETDPSHWTKGAAARDAKGQIVYAKSSDAYSCCLTGGIDRYGTNSAQKERLTRYLKKFLPNNYRSVESFNDGQKTVLDDVLHVLKSVELHLRHSN